MPPEPLYFPEASKLAKVYVNVGLASGGDGTPSNQYGRDFAQASRNLFVVEGTAFGHTKWGGIHPTTNIDEYALVGRQVIEPGYGDPWRLRGDYRPTWTSVGGSLYKAVITEYYTALAAKYLLNPIGTCTLFRPDDHWAVPRQALLGYTIDVVHQRTTSAIQAHDSRNSPDTALVTALAAINSTNRCAFVIDHDGTVEVYLDYTGLSGTPTTNGDTVLLTDSFATTNGSQNIRVHELTNPDQYCPRLLVKGLSIGFAGRADGASAGSRFTQIRFNNIEGACVFQDYYAVLNSGGDGVALLQQGLERSTYYTDRMIIHRGASELGPIGVAPVTIGAAVSWVQDDDWILSLIHI